MTHLRLHYIQTLKEVSNGVKTYTTLFLTGILAQTFQTAPTRVQVFFNVYIMWCVCVCVLMFLPSAIMKAIILLKTILVLK